MAADGWVDVYTVDAFSAAPFSGNPASVCLLSAEWAGGQLTDQLMLAVAAEMKHSETAFVSSCSPEESFSSGSTFQLRWFTPTTEVQLCGHATLATAAVLFQICKNTNPVLTFVTRWGVRLTATRDADRIVLDLPLNAPAPADRAEFSQLISTVCGQLNVTETQLSTDTGKLLLRLADRHSREQLELMQPDLEALVRAETSGRVRGVIVTLRDGQQYDFLSRYFAPWVGIPEDPVTGSAHTVLGAYWSRQLATNQLTARQCSPRGGDLGLTVDWERARLLVAGCATIVLQGKLYLGRQ